MENTAHISVKILETKVKRLESKINELVAAVDAADTFILENVEINKCREFSKELQALIQKMK